MDLPRDCTRLHVFDTAEAVARALALSGREVLILDAAEAIGTVTSSRNSEVVHAGIYYPAGSLKARFCVAGKQALYAYCAERGVPHARLGKLIVATSEEEVPVLDSIRAKARAVMTPLAAGISPSSSGVSPCTNALTPGKYIAPNAAENGSAAMCGATTLKIGFCSRVCGPMMRAGWVGACTGGRPR